MGGGGGGGVHGSRLGFEVGAGGGRRVGRGGVAGGWRNVGEVCRAGRPGAGGVEFEVRLGNVDWGRQRGRSGPRESGAWGIRFDSVDESQLGSLPGCSHLPLGE